MLLKFQRLRFTGSLAMRGQSRAIKILSCTAVFLGFHCKNETVSKLGKPLRGKQGSCIFLIYLKNFEAIRLVFILKVLELQAYKCLRLHMEYSEKIIRIHLKNFNFNLISKMIMWGPGA